jgi:hypothetical protein
MSPETSVGGSVIRGVAVPAGTPLVGVCVKLHCKDTGSPPVAGASQETLVRLTCQPFGL